MTQLHQKKIDKEQENNLTSDTWLEILVYKLFGDLLIVIIVEDEISNR